MNVEMPDPLSPPSQVRPLASSISLLRQHAIDVPVDQLRHETPTISFVCKVRIIANTRTLFCGPSFCCQTISVGRRKHAVTKLDANPIAELAVGATTLFDESHAQASVPREIETRHSNRNQLALPHEQGGPTAILKGCFVSAADPLNDVDRRCASRVCEPSPNEASDAPKALIATPACAGLGSPRRGSHWRMPPAVCAIRERLIARL